LLSKIRVDRVTKKLKKVEHNIKCKFLSILNIVIHFSDQTCDKEFLSAYPLKLPENTDSFLDENNYQEWTHSMLYFEENARMEEISRFEFSSPNNSKISLLHPNKPHSK